MVNTNNRVVSTHLKMYKSNFFCIVSDGSGQVIFTKNSGNLGFSNIQKRSIEALNSLLEICLKEILLLKKKYIFLKFEGLKASFSKDVYKHLIFFLKKNNIILIGFKSLSKISHNGCRIKR
jgi:ribosomal protein S11